MSTVADATGMVRAMRLAAPGEFEPTMRPLRLPGPGEVGVRIEGCGVCASNVPPWRGADWFTYPFEPGAPGHEAWGVVMRVGPGVATLTPGDRVTFLSAHAFAEHAIVDAEACVPIPASLDGKPFPGEPLACAVNVGRRAEIEAGHKVAVIGAGFLGNLLIQIASRRGADVIAISRRGSSLEHAKRSGSSHEVTMQSREQVTREVLTATGGALCDRVIECTGYQEPLTLAGELTRVRGRLVIAGYHQDGSRTIDMQLWNWRGIDVVNAHERDDSVYVSAMREVIRLVETGELDPFPLYTHCFALEDLNQALEAAADRPDGFVKALVTT